jgi:Ala-tRNA(Pro) deacylase
VVISERLRELLAEEYAAYRVMPHPQPRGGPEETEAAQPSERDLAKVLVVKDRAGDYFMIALPCDCRLDLTAAARATGRKGLRLASEGELARLFPDCQSGAVPPFGALYGLPLYVDACFRGHPEMVFAGGTPDELIAMRFQQYESLAKPAQGRWCFHTNRRTAA